MAAKSKAKADATMDAVLGRSSPTTTARAASAAIGPTGSRATGEVETPTAAASGECLPIPDTLI